MSSVEKRYLIGRDPGCAVPIADDSVSRRHAELIVSGDQLILRDAGSANGTILIRQGQRRPLQQEVVFPTDSVQFGAVQLTVRDLVESVRARPAPPPVDGPAGAPVKLVRCACGAIKPAGKPCAECGR